MVSISSAPFSPITVGDLKTDGYLEEMNVTESSVSSEKDYNYQPYSAISKHAFTFLQYPIRSNMVRDGAYRLPRLVQYLMTSNGDGLAINQHSRLDNLEAIASRKYFDPREWAFLSRMQLVPRMVGLLSFPIYINKNSEERTKPKSRIYNNLKINDCVACHSGNAQIYSSETISFSEVKIDVRNPALESSNVSVLSSYFSMGDLIKNKAMIRKSAASNLADYIDGITM